MPVWEEAQFKSQITYLYQVITSWFSASTALFVLALALIKIVIINGQ